jgi:alpha-tubulin suppressor-like RCC1 family protein
MSRSVSVQIGVLAGVALLAGCGSSSVVEPLPSPFASVTAGLLHTCGLLGDGSAFCWGNNQFSQLGDGSQSGRTAPVAVAASLKFVMVSPGGGHTCGVSTTGAAYCWGYNVTGELGDGTHTDHAGPAPVNGASAWMTVSSGGEYSCGIAADSTAYCWGWNGYGQVGDSTNIDRSSPTPVSGGHKFVAISAGSFHSCALAADGAAYCWGANDFGELGTGNQTPSVIPAAVQGGLLFRSIAVGYYSTCALTVDGAGYCWGENQFGQLGLSDDSIGHNESRPMAVAGGITWSVLDAGAYFGCGVQEGTGTAYCWGLNSSGQLGADVSGVCSDQSGASFQCVGSPFAVSGGLTFASISAATQHTCGLTQDQVAYCWGLDSDGQLGDGQQGTTVFQNAPVKVLGQP